MDSLLGSNSNLYYILGTTSTFILFIFNLSQIKYKKHFIGNLAKTFQKYFQEKNKSISKILSNNTFWAIIETLIISCIQYLPISFLNFKFGKLIGTGANYYGLLFFIPYILFFCCYLIKIPPLKQIDLITPAFPLALTVSKLACFFAGCCRGMECSFGLYNYSTQCVEFPVQLVEAAIAFIIFIFLMFWRKKARLGTMFPTYLVVYSFSRFFSEFFRIEPNILWGLKKYHFLCITGVILGIIQLIIINKYRNKIKNQ